MSASAMPWDSGKMVASVLWCSGSIECFEEGVGERYVRLGFEVFPVPCSRLLSSATVHVSDAISVIEATFLVNERIERNKSF